MKKLEKKVYKKSKLVLQKTLIKNLHVIEKVS